MMEGDEIPLHRSLTEVIRPGGVPRTPAILLWPTSAAIGFGLQQIWVLAFAILMHVVLVALTRRDPFFFEVFIRALKSPKRLDP